MRTYLAVIWGFLLIQTQWTHAESKLLPFQGRVANSEGGSVPDGPRVIRFRISESPVDNTFKWAGELHRATVNGGLINVVLGSKTPLAGVDFGKQLFLEVTVDSNNDGAVTEADLPMLPRQAILPVLFAHEAENSRKWAGREWTAVFGTNDPLGSWVGSRIVDGSITSDKLSPESIDMTRLTRSVVEALNPPGTVLSFAGEKVPAGWLLCDGSALDKDQPTYQALWDAIGTNWGDGRQSSTNAAFGAITNITDFNIPDLRGLFLRGVSGVSTNDPSREARSSSAAGGNPGNRVGSLQGDELKEHTHQYTDYAVQGGSNPKVGGGGAYDRQFITRVTEPRGGEETRPKNAYVNFIIKY